MIKFNGKEYSTKQVNVPDFGERLISVESLEESLMDAEGFYVSDEAQVIDEKIFFYVPDDVINKDEKAIAKFVDECIRQIC